VGQIYFLLIKGPRRKKLRKIKCKKRSKRIEAEEGYETRFILSVFLTKKIENFKQR
jgi:hypothetical protein